MDPYLVARFLHIFFAALWFGLTIGGGQKALLFAREGLEQRTDPKVFLLKNGILGAFAGFATLAAGTWLVSQTGGWEDLPTPIHVGAYLAIVMFVIGALPISIGWKKLAKSRSNGVAQTELEAIARRIGLWERALQLLWIITLATMVFRHI